MVKYLDNLDYFMYFVWFNLWLKSLDNSLSCLRLTTLEIQRATFLFYCCNYLKCGFFLIISILLTPFGLMFYITWFIFFRKLFRFENFKKSICHNSCLLRNKHEQSNKNLKFEILSINVCLLPDSLSRENNLFLTEQRLEAIGKLINKTQPNLYCHSHLFSKKNTNELSEKFTYKTKSKNNEESKLFSKNEFNIKIEDNFMDNVNADFVCMQEVVT